MEKVDTPNTHIHNRSLPLVGKSTSIKSGEVKLVLWAKIRSRKSKKDKQCNGQKKTHKEANNHLQLNTQKFKD